MRRRTIAEHEAEIASLRLQNAKLTQDLAGTIDLLVGVCREYGITLKLKVRDDTLGTSTEHPTSLE